MTTTSSPRAEADFAVIGGGLVGTAIAWGLARLGQRVVVLDEGDVAFRASRGNFALVWVQSKGLGMPRYARWTKTSSDSWRELADELKRTTEIDVCFGRPGGFMPALSEAELEARTTQLKRLHNQPDMVSYPWEILDRAQITKQLPELGPEVVGGTYCAIDGHTNALKLLRAFHTGLAGLGARYMPASPVESIERAGGAFRVRHAGGELVAARVVLAAGIANARLAPPLGMTAPVRPQRGQIVVTERLAPFLHHPIVTVRQTDEGTVMMGDSKEEAGFDTSVGTPVVSTIAERAVRMFPLLARANVVRTWAALRVMTKDGFPIYQQSSAHPGAFLATCHSGVTLAAAHALHLAPMLVAKAFPDDMAPFHPQRFDVSSAA
jgi:glycine/D-amino acid oxidase-like deaminating enzyme